MSPLVRTLISGGKAGGEAISVTPRGVKMKGRRASPRLPSVRTQKRGHNMVMEEEHYYWTGASRPILHEGPLEKSAGQIIYTKSMAIS